MSSAEDLALRQQQLVAALTHPGEPAGLPGIKGIDGIDGSMARGLLAYRVNAQALSGKALAAVFPRLRESFGGREFEAMAWAFWRGQPPQRGDLALWGGGLAEFLAAQNGMEAGFCDLARLEWAMHAAERAADAALDVASLSLLGGSDPARLGLRMRPGVTLLQQTGGPVLVWRKGFRACSAPLAAGEAVFMRSLLAGSDLAAALDLAAGTGFDFSVWLQTALREAWLQAALLSEHHERETP